MPNAWLKTNILLSPPMLLIAAYQSASGGGHVIDCVIEEMPFPIQRFQTDRGREFFVVKVQERLQE